MRIFSNCYEVISEMHRDVYEMGVVVKPKSMQNLNVQGNDDYITKEIVNYQYCLTKLDKVEALFIQDISCLDWCKAEFSERVSTNGGNPGNAWLLRKETWEPLMSKEGRFFDYTYQERMVHGLEKLIKEGKRNPDSRQLILSVWDPIVDISGIGGKKRVPCSVYYHFLIRGGKVDIIYNQRSADVVTHMGNDIYLAWRLMEYFAEKTGNAPGKLYHNIGSLHSYKKDWDKLKAGISKLRNGNEG